MKPLRFRHYTGVYKYDNKSERKDHDEKLNEFGIFLAWFVYSLFINNMYFWGLLTIVSIYSFIDRPDSTGFMIIIVTGLITYVTATFGRRIKDKGKLSINQVRNIQRKKYRKIGFNSYSKSVSNIAYYNMCKVFEELNYYTLVSKSGDKTHVDYKKRVYEIVQLPTFEFLLNFDDDLVFRNGHLAIYATSDVEMYEKLTDSVNVALSIAGFPDLNVSDIKREHGGSIVIYEIKDDNQRDGFDLTKGVVTV